MKRRSVAALLAVAVVIAWPGNMAALANLPNCSNCIEQGDIATDAVGAPEIKSGAVRAPEIATDAVGSSEIESGAVRASEIATGAVGSSEIATDAVGAAEIAAAAIGVSEIATDAVGAAEIAADAVGASEIATDAVGASEISSAAVGPDEIATDAVGAAEIATGAVGASEIATDAVGTSEIADGAIATADLAPDVQVETADTYSGTSSFQLLAADLTLDAAAGTSAAGDSAFLSSVMGNVLGADLTEDNNYVGGLIGHYSVTGTNASSYPVGGVLAGIGDGTTTADGAVVAYIDGDSSATTAGAAFKVMSNNSTPASGFDFGLDLQDAAHDGYLPVDEDFYLKAPVRLVRDVVVLVDDAAPTDGTSGTGAGVAGPGSMYVDTDGATLYINTNTKASPTWTVVGTQT